MKRTRMMLAAVAAATVVLAGCSSGGAASTSDAAAAAATTAATPASDSGLPALVPADLRERGYISVASDIPYPPMEMLDADGNVTGLDYDLSQAMAEVLDIEFRFEKQAWDSIIPSLKSGRHDIIMSGMNDTKERQQTLSFVDYFQGGMAILVRAGNPDAITTLLDLCGKTVAVEEATVQGDLVRKMSEQCPAGTEIGLMELPSDADAQNAVRADKATADILDAAVAAYAAKTAGGGKYFEVVVDPDNPEGYLPVFTGIGILRENTELIEAIRAALQELIDTGVYQQLLEKYDLLQYAVDSATVNAATE